MKKSTDRTYLTKREQQIMELLFQHGRLSANQLLGLLPGAPSNSAIRGQLRILEGKGQVTHKKVSGEFFYSPVQPKNVAGNAALKKVLHTFYQGSIRDVVVSLLADPAAELSDEDLNELNALIEQARKEGR